MRKVDLWYYLPEFLKNFLELNEILEAEEPEFQMLVKQCDDVMNDMFITTATTRGISRYEEIMGIRPDAGTTLESRRSAVMTRWWDATPYTIRALKNRIAIIQGNADIQISFAEDNPYLIQIVTRLESPGQVDDLAYILETMLPANLVVDSDNRIEVDLKVGLSYGMGASVAGTLFLTNDLNETVQTGLEHKIGVGMSDTTALFLTNDLNESVNVSGKARVGMASGFTNVLELY